MPRGAPGVSPAVPGSALYARRGTQLPTKVEIRSHRSYIGWAIVAYKKLIRAVIGPYLNTLLGAERESLRRESKESLQGELKAQAREFETIAEDMLRRTNALFAVLNGRIEELEKKLEDRKKGS